MLQALKESPDNYAVSNQRKKDTCNFHNSPSRPNKCKCANEALNLFFKILIFNMGGSDVQNPLIMAKVQVKYKAAQSIPPG
jgi:hypothetical protein